MLARMVGTGLLAATVVAAVVPQSVAARTLHVSPSGVGCPRAAFTRIQTAIDAAGDGDKVVISADKQGLAFNGKLAAAA